MRRLSQEPIFAMPLDNVDIEWPAHYVEKRGCRLAAIFLGLADDYFTTIRYT